MIGPFKSVRVRFDCICPILLEMNFYHIQAKYYPYIITDVLGIEKKALEKNRVGYIRTKIRKLAIGFVSPGTCVGAKMYFL